LTQFIRKTYWEVYFFTVINIYNILLYKYCINLYVKLTRTFYSFILELRLLRIYVLKLYYFYVIYLFIHKLCYFSIKKCWISIWH